MGELNDEVIKFITQEKINVSSNETQADRLIWRGGKYKVVRVKNNKDWGFYRAFGIYEGEAE